MKRSPNSKIAEKMVTGKIRKVEMREKSVSLLHLEEAAATRNA